MRRPRFVGGGRGDLGTICLPPPPLPPPPPPPACSAPATAPAPLALATALAVELPTSSRPSPSPRLALTTALTLRLPPALATALRRQSLPSSCHVNQSTHSSSWSIRALNQPASGPVLITETTVAARQSVAPSSSTSISTRSPSRGHRHPAGGGGGKAAAASGSKVTHRVKSGETLYSIARRYGVTIAQIVSWNGISANRTLRVGQRLTIRKRG